MELSSSKSKKILKFFLKNVFIFDSLEFYLLEFSSSKSSLSESSEEIFLS